MLRYPETIKSRKLLPLLSLTEKREEIVWSGSSKSYRYRGVAACQTGVTAREMAPVQGGREQGRKTLTSFSFCPTISWWCLLVAKSNPKPEEKGAWVMQSIGISLPEQRSGKRKVEKKICWWWWRVQTESYRHKCFSRNPRWRPIMHSGLIWQNGQSKNNLKILPNCARPTTSC